MLRFLCGMFLLLCLIGGCGATKETGYRTVSPLDPNHIAAQELKLKVREMADQLLAGLPNDVLTGYVALPVSFVSQNNFTQSSPLGRYLAEALIFEFNQRGFPVREYRADGVITMQESMGESALKRGGKISTAKGRGNALLMGTYHQDPDAVFVNARLVRAADGIVMRTAQIMLTPNPVITRMGRDATPGKAIGDGPLFAGASGTSGLRAAPKAGVSGRSALRFRQATPRVAKAGPKPGLVSVCP